MEPIVGSRLLSKHGEVKTAAALQSTEIVGLYFSAHWCGPCQSFTPELIEFYDEINREGKRFEVIFVSSDNDVEAMSMYYAMMPWLAVPFDRRDIKTELSSKFKVRGIPTLVILEGATGNLITRDGRAGVSGSGKASFPWRPKSLSQLVRSAGLLEGKGSKRLSAESLAAKYVLLYFSAHWCPPCRGFTPQLVAFYHKLKEAKGDSFELIFVSSDKNREAFNEYFNEMPWFAVPYELRELKDDLSEHLDVNGIPTLALLGPETAQGDRPIITTSARSNVADPDAINDFPEGWAPKPYADIATTVECDGADINQVQALVVLAEKASSDLQAAAVRAVKTAAELYKRNSQSPRTLFFYATTGAGPVGRVRAVVNVQAKSNPTVLMLDIPNGVYYVAHDDIEVSPDAIINFLANPGPSKELGS